jgi:hypothetical protein
MSNPPSTGHDEGKKSGFSHQTMLENRMLARILAREAAEKIFKILLLTKYNHTSLNRIWA